MTDSAKTVLFVMALGMACWPVARGLAADRVIAVAADTPATEVSRYYSLHGRGPTRKFFVFPAARAVLVVATADGRADASATIHLFPATTEAEGIEKWINNQHSDALFADAAEPERSIAVPAERFHGRAGPPLDHEVGPGGDEYDRVRVEFVIDPFEDGDVRVEASRAALDAFIRTKDLPQPRGQ